MTNFQELITQQNQEHQNIIKKGTILKGLVIDLNNDFVIVDVGLKSEGYIERKEFLNTSNEITITPGDEVEIMVEDLDDGKGNISLSREAVCCAELWEELKNSLEESLPIKVNVVSVVKGGLIVEIGLFKGFLPRSLVSTDPVDDLNEYLNQEISCKIIKMDEKKKNIIVSRRLLFEANPEEKKQYLDQLEEGMIISGKVKNITDYGAFIDLGPIDGLVHITDISWQRIKHPSDILNVGEEIKVKVLKFDYDNLRVSLGIKQIQEDPWMHATNILQSGSTVDAEVSTIVEYGAFVKIQDGVEGLIHASEINWTNRNVNTSKILTVGQKIKVKILEIDKEKRRISLSIKQCQENPWELFSSQYKPNDIIKVTVSSIIDFGLFVSLPNGLTGLIHSSDLPLKEGESVVSLRYQKGDELEAVINSIDPEKERISLSINKIALIRLKDYLSKFPIGSHLKGTVEKASKLKAYVKLEDGIFGNLILNELSDTVEVKDVSLNHKVGSEIECMITGFDNKTAEINLSVRAMEASNESDALKTYSQNNQDNQTTLGDALREKITISKNENDS